MENFYENSQDNRKRSRHVLDDMLELNDVQQRIIRKMYNHTREFEANKLFDHSKYVCISGDIKLRDYEELTDKYLAAKEKIKILKESLKSAMKTIEMLSSTGPDQSENSEKVPVNHASNSNQN